MKINVTPSPLTPPPTETALPPGEPESKKNRLLIYAGAVLIVLVIIGIVFLAMKPSSPGTSTTTIKTTGAYLSACGNVNAPGTYALSSDIKTGTTNNACLNVTASGVSISCGGKSITGSGPYVGVPPYSYGIKVSGVQNVTISDCVIGNFSFGVYTVNVNGFTFDNNTMSYDYMANLYMSATQHSQVVQNNFYHAGGPLGSVYIAPGSGNNTFINNTVRYNTYAGIAVNATGNRFLDNRLNASNYEFSCTGVSGFPTSGSAVNNACQVNNGCGFLSCSQTNIPVNLSTVHLATDFASCGVIDRPGNYHMTGGINANNYINAPFAELALYNSSCVTITADNVDLNCANNTVSNGYIGIFVHGNTNVTLSNCRTSDTGIGLLLSRTIATVENAKFVNSSVSGVEVASSYGDLLKNVRATNGLYGFWLQNASSDTFDSYFALNNTFGVYVSNSLGNIFDGGTALSNTRVDVFAANDSSGSSANLMGTSSCGNTNAKWATCSHFITNFNYNPVTSCTTITKPGNYTLLQGLAYASSGCINIQSNNVKFNCLAGKTIQTPNPVASGPAIQIQERSNVTVDNCGISGFRIGLLASNSSNIKISNITGSAAWYVMFLNNIKGATIVNNTVGYASNVTVYLNNVSRSTIINNNVSNGANTNVGIFVNNSARNMIENNSGFSNGVGMQFAGLSANNTVLNNNFYLSSTADYNCTPQDSAVNFESGRINQGASKLGCNWAAIIDVKQGQTLQCASLTSSLYSLSGDAVYPYGTTCFVGATKHSTIDCQGHTIVATNGGTFAYFQNTSAPVLENCYLIGFTTPVVVRGADAQILNNTIYVNSTALNSNYSAINVYQSVNPVVQGNKVITPYTGIRLNGMQFGRLANNNVSTPGIAYWITNTTSTKILNNTNSKDTATGMLLVNSTTNSFQYNNFPGGVGIACLGSSQVIGSGNGDLGSNACSYDSKCAWMTSSPSCAPH